MIPEALVRLRRPIVFALHALLIPLGYFLAFALRFDAPVPHTYLVLFGVTVLYLLPIRLVVFRFFGLYHGWWRHVGMQDLTDLVKAVTLSSVLFTTALVVGPGLTGFPRSVLILDWVMAVLVFGGARALVIGAGEAAERLIRQLRPDYVFHMAV